LITKHTKYIDAVTADLLDSKKHNKRTIEKLASGFGIENKNLIKELTELAIVNIARKYANNNKVSVNERYNKIVGLYRSQVNLSHRTSESIRLQQYSTPAPIGYIAGVFCGMDKKPKKFYFEPSAGNGLLTIAAKPEWFVVNEIDDIRNTNLKTQAYRKVMKQDASKSFVGFEFQVDSVITNPPFGVLADRERAGNFTTKTLDHLMAAIALQTMKHDGKAAIIIGGHTHWDDHGRIQKGKNRDFFMWLYHNYNVMDVINIDGHKLYSRQGVAVDVRLILINGRKIKPEGFPPLKRVTDVTVDTFDELYNRVTAFAGIESTKEVKVNTTFTLSDEQTKNIKDGKSAKWGVSFWREDSQNYPSPRPTLIGEDNLKEYKVGQVVDYNGRNYELIDIIKGLKLQYQTIAKLRDLKTKKVKTTKGFHGEAEIRVVQQSQKKAALRTNKKSNTADIKSEKISKAKQLGKKAFADGKLRIAGRDTELLKMFKGKHIGDPDTIKIMTSWYVGWDESNLSKTTKNNEYPLKQKRIRISSARAKAKLRILELENLKGISMTVEMQVYDSHTGRINNQSLQSYRQAIEVIRDWINDMYPKDLPSRYSVSIELQHYDDKGNEEEKKRNVIKVLTAKQINAIRKAGYKI